MKRVTSARTASAAVLKILQKILHMRYQVIGSKFKVQGSKPADRADPLGVLLARPKTLNPVEDVLRRADGVAVNLHRVVDVLGVAARHDGRDGHAARTALGVPQAVARAQPPDGEREPAQTVAGEGVCAAEVEDDFGPVREDARQVA